MKKLKYILKFFSPLIRNINFSLIFADCVGFKILIYNMLGNWYIMNLRTIEFCMLCLAKFARKNLELIQNIFVFVSQIRVEFIVHGGLIQNIDEFAVVQIIQNGVD